MHDYYRIAEALKYIREHMQEQPSLETIARAVHISPFHFQRMFTSWAGVSPKKFLHYLSVEHAKKVLQKAEATVYDAAFETGLSGTGRLHDLFVNIEGMTPGEFRNGGRALQITYSVQNSHFGPYLAAATTRGVCHLAFFENSEAEAVEEMRALWPEAGLARGQNSFLKQVDQFFSRSGAVTGKIPLHLRATPFQLKVWKALLQIPEGALQTYGSIARQIESPAAQRAVGTAIGSNPVAYLIPCHRVIRSVGGIGQYRWGADRKMALIGWEASQRDIA